MLKLIHTNIILNGYKFNDYFSLIILKLTSLLFCYNLLIPKFL